MGSTIIEQDFPYDIMRRGQRDASRHNKRVEDAAKKQLKDIISQQDIISSEKNRKVKVKLKHLNKYRFRHNKDRIDEIGRDNFDELTDGEVIYRPQPKDGGGPQKPGEDPGEEIYEAEFSMEQITDMMIKELNLPDLDEKKKNEIISEVIEYNDIRKKQGVFSCIDRKRTLLANILRRAKQKQLGEEKNTAVLEDDLRFRTWQVAQEKHSNAVVFLIMDTSGSMVEDRIYAVKALYFWIVQFLKRKYNRVDLRFIRHDTVAKETNEKDFFAISPDGGTKVLPAFQLCQDIIKHNYPSNSWNTYCFYASDGDAFERDAAESIKLAKEIVNAGATIFAYTEITIAGVFGNRADESEIYKMFDAACHEVDGIMASKIAELPDVLTTLKMFLRKSVKKLYV